MALGLLGLLVAATTPPATDYCDMLGQDDIQGKKSGLLTGNKVFYVGGTFLVQKLYENETVGLFHPFFHDLRSRGTGIAYYESVGTGNDFNGWEWYRTTKVALGHVIADGIRWNRPAPERMYWRPDKMVVEYNLTDPYLKGVYNGWCADWREGSSNGTGLGKSFWTNLTEEACWGHCAADDRCMQAVYEGTTDLANSQCWTGLNMMPKDDLPKGMRPGCNPPSCIDKCYAYGVSHEPVHIREEKFISANDVVSTRIVADRPVKVEFMGNSFDAKTGSGQVVSLNGSCSHDALTNSVRIVEGGVVNAMVAQNPDVYVEGKLMYDGMSAVMIADREMINVSTYTVSAGVCGYNFTLPLDTKGVTLSWGMDDDYATALKAVQAVQADAATAMAAKTATVNKRLNEVVPYFRSSDTDLVKVYYFLWSLYLGYYTQGDRGMQKEPHTQTAVNNFLGVHRYDDVFQILVGSWTAPAVHATYANGNVLAWNATMKYKNAIGQLPDNFGVDWVSGCYGSETIGHLIGAWQIYEHSGNKTFLASAYTFYKDLFWGEITGNLFGYVYDAVLALNKMAETLGVAEDAKHWNATINMPDLNNWLTRGWQKGKPHLWGATTAGVKWGNIAVCGMSQFPRNWTVDMANYWIDDPTVGFAGKVPLTCVAKTSWPTPLPDPDAAEYNFAITPDANWYMLRGLYSKQIDKIANKYTLRHLREYNMEWGIPVAPETRKMDWSLHGDQYSNFNAGKILLYLEGLGGLSYSVVDDTFTYADNLPTDWDYMEFGVPVLKPGDTETTWVHVRSQRTVSGTTVTKNVSITNNPFGTLVVRPWAEDEVVVASSPAGANPNASTGHVQWVFHSSSANVSLTLHPRTLASKTLVPPPSAQRGAGMVEDGVKDGEAVW